MKSVLALLLVPAAAAAAPKPPLCAPMSDAISLVATGENLVVCWGEKGDCVQLGKAVADRKVVPRPAPVKGVEVKEKELCQAGTCKPIGKALAKALAKAKQGATPEQAVWTTATADLGMVVVVAQGAADAERTQIWNVAKDKRITPKAPAELKKTGEKPNLIGALAVGAAVLADWSICAGPCTMTGVIDASGAVKGSMFPAGYAIDLDGKRIAVVPSEASSKLTVADGKTGKILGQLPIGDGTSAVERSSIAKLPGDDFAVIAAQGDVVSVIRVSAPAAGKPTIVWTQPIEACAN